MARPQKNKKTGMYHFRQKTPVDLVGVFGRKEVVYSLKTKDPAEAKTRNVEALRRQSLIWESLRKKPEPIPHQQIVALSGVLYRDYMAMLELEPGEPEIWHETRKRVDRVEDAQTLAEWYGPTVDSLLLEHGIVADAASRQRLLIEANRAFRQVVEEQGKRSEGGL